MDIDRIFKFELYLEKMSAISVAISYWDRSDVKKLMREGFSGGAGSNYYDPEELNYKGDSSGQKVINYILKQVDLLKYPEQLMCKVKFLIVKIGEKIYNWRDYVVNILRLNERYAETIYWTSYGQIDEVKIVEQFWLRDQYFRNERSCSCFVSRGGFCMAAKYALENFVTKNMEAMKSNISPYLSQGSQKLKWTVYGIIAAHIVSCRGYRETVGVQNFKSFKKSPNKLPAKNLFQLCIDHKYEYAAKYFWHELKKNEKQELVVQNAEMFVKVYTSKKDVSARMLLFFLGEMTEVQKIEFLTQNFVSVFTLLIAVWPYQEICVKLLDRFVDFVPEHRTTLLKLSLTYLTKRSKKCYINNENFHPQVFHILLGRISKELKEAFFFTSNLEEIKKLYQSSNYDILSIIIKDADLKFHRSLILNAGLPFFKRTMLRGGDLESINEFINNFEPSDESVKSLKLNLLNSFLFSGELNLVDEHLKWLADSEEERNKLKNQVDPVKIFSALIQNNQFRAANDLLSWRLDAEEERKTVKESFKSDEFLRDKIFELWGMQSNSLEDKVVSICSDLLNLFFETEEEILDFKKSKIITDDFFIEKYWDALFYGKSFQNLNKFLNFCLYESDSIEVLKTSIRFNVKKWIDTFGLKKDKFEMLDALLEWVFPDKKEKENAIRSYMSTPSGLRLCIAIFKNFGRYSDRIVKFFNLWIDSTFDFIEMRELLNKCFFREDIVKCIKAMLKKRKEDQEIREKDLARYIKLKTFFTESHYNPHGYFLRSKGWRPFTDDEDEEEEDEEYDSSDW